MILLDVLPITPEERIERIRRIKPVVVDTVDKVRETISDTIEAAKDSLVDSVAQSQLILDNAGGASSEASLLLPVGIVALALVGCVYLAHMYRRRRAVV
ncbi:MAG: hypothetical protein IJ907_02080 [Prevotella sp.]|nr:hypothetical protein [Prevotella sp.]